MRKILKIAGTEIRILFVSPIAWIILAIFSFHTAMAYTDLLDVISMQQSFRSPLWYSVTKGIYSGNLGVFFNIKEHLYLYIPLLTMGLMSQEYGSGSIKLLYSSPVSSHKIIWGKFLSMAAYGLILCGILATTIVLSAFHIENFDLPLSLSGLLGIYLLIVTYSAIGLFMSSLTSYQVVAAICTLGILSFLNYIKYLWQDIGFIRDITYWLSLSGRTEELTNGLICSEDILYFIIITLFFLSLSIIKLESGKLSGSVERTLKYIIVSVCTLAAGYLSRYPKFTFYHDSTAVKSETLTETSREVMEQLNGGLKITTYVNLLDPDYHEGAPHMVNTDIGRFKKYIRFKPDLKMEYVYYYEKCENKELDEKFPRLSLKGKAQKLAEIMDVDFENFLSPEEIKKHVDLKEEGYRFVRIIERDNGEKTFLRIFDDSRKFPLENEISTAMKRLAVRAPRIGFSRGHGERNSRKPGDREYLTFAKEPRFRHSLINKGFDLCEVEISEGIPETVDILVIADPQSDFNTNEIQNISDYIDAGKNLILIGEPENRDIIQPLFDLIGIETVPGTIVCPTGIFDDDMLFCKFTAEGCRLIPSYKNLLHKKYVISMPGAMGIKTGIENKFRTYPVLCTDTTSWNEIDTEDFINEKATCREGTEIRQSYSTMIALTREGSEREQRIIVIGDADCISNAELVKTRQGVNASNYSLITGIFHWMSYGEFPLIIVHRNPKDTGIAISQAGIRRIKFFLKGFIPLFFIVFGLWTILKRKCK